MGKTIEVRLSDAQHAQLIAESEAAGQTFYGYCRTKLTVGPGGARSAMTIERLSPTDRIGLPEEIARMRRIEDSVARDRFDEQRAEMRENDRIARIEDAVAKLTDYVLQGQPAPEIMARAQSAEPTQPPDVDSIVEAQFHEAEAQGLTERIPDENEEVMRHAGVRPLSRRPIPFSANSGPKHLAGL